MNVLLVDDNATNRKLLGAVLQGEGLQTCEAADGVEALAILKSQPFDAIISDILMPKMDGYRFCFEVRRHAEFAEIPFIFYTATYTSLADEKLGLQAGASAFLRKPASAKEILDALSDLLNQAPRPPLQRRELPEELTLMQEYSEQLVAKLEEKNAELQGRTQELQELSRRLLAVQESEKHHLARELHDEIGQTLSVLKLHLAAIEVSDSEGRPGRVTDCIRLADQMLQQVRGMALNLRPSILDDLGLIPALRWYISHHPKQAGLTVVLEAADEDCRYHPAVETACFRVAQEALTNVVRHAGAKAVTISLGEAGGALQLRVHDDGAGFDVAAARKRAQRGTSFGLVGMLERATLAGGQLHIESSPVHGTAVFAQFPFAGTAAAAAGSRSLQP